MFEQNNFHKEVKICSYMGWNAKWHRKTYYLLFFCN